ncbi:YibE/F family protein [Liquorilactobacillus cacaonum]|uniref:Multitransmembrane protein n=1 Tax=Liquorilactobacillus cacaonum DSM 21116 TaxID=1423729 RepID=A0A0R2CY15_9LACO|nr:YibE/F family protein [Liquorilactobacillus cacaonum]KRM92939.1 hypothetical protein FC80_GL000027 [Liquorilactobacillus cacaonum DSM 21116]
MRKKLFFECIIMILGAIVIFVISTHDAFLYKQTILQVTEVSQGKTFKTSDEYGNHDKKTNQRVDGLILNGEKKGKKFSFQNTYAASGGLSQNYQKGQQIFVTISKENGKYEVTPTNYKRDTYLFMMCWIMICLLFIVMKIDGLRTIISVLINFILFLIIVQLDVWWNITNFFVIFAVSAVIFTAITLAMIVGLNKQFWVTFLSIVSGTSIALLISIVIMWITQDNGMHYEALDFATQQPKQLFLSATLIGLLGTVMDASTDIVSTLFELKRSQPQVTFQQLYQSGREVGKDIMGPLINVLLLIFFAETFTMAVLYFRTGNTIGYTFSWTMSLGLTQAVISGIGIALVIPAASLIAAWSLGGSEK